MKFPDRRKIVKSLGITPEMEVEWERLLDEYYGAMPQLDEAGEFLLENPIDGLCAENYKGMNVLCGWDESKHGSKESILDQVASWRSDKLQKTLAEQAKRSSKESNKDQIKVLIAKLKDGRATDKDRDDLVLFLFEAVGDL